ncbi:preprotein translocase subunit SecA [Candidatus Parcubacteria bacterium]|jgi:preprotein translocase subunit SecA|nr:preprotein translocase subunit SecA [Candidatus Parcubacteria bacterium]
MSFLHKMFGDQNKKILKEIQPTVDKINSLESEFEKLSDDDLKAKTPEFKKRLEKGESLDDLLVEAFATVREVGKRTMGMRHYDVQLVGGIVLHRGTIAEMRTGEGKTLTATLPVYLNALDGKGVHLITVNDYLAKRDAVWMAEIYDFLGLSVGIIQNQRVTFVYDREKEKVESEKEETDGSFKVEDEYLRTASRKDAYECDITYGTNNEFGFDYLRDNMVQDVGQMVMRPKEEMSYCIIDEIDSILIDEARTPLIISAPAEEATDQYHQFAKWVRMLKENEDYNLDEKMRAATLTDEGISKFERWLNVDNLYVEGGIMLVHHIEQALKSEVLFKRDKDYIVEGGEIVIIDEFTGRKMPGRRYSEGMHQAIEAKEGVKIQRESRTLATITFQNLFRMYTKLSGMTGTAKTEEEEFYKIYGMEVVVVPTNRPDARTDFPDRIYKNDVGKNKAIIEKLKECQSKGQPVLVGTISVEKNEELSQYLEINGIKHEILNAKNHEREGEIIAQAGRPGAVTLATNMAGRGVDIKLGGPDASKEESQKIKDAGGLFVLGTERHESRRIDNQLRGRSARQGDPGETQFFVSTDDDLMRIFAGDKLKGVMTRMKVPEDMPIEQKFITRMLESAQKKVESHHFDTRKHLLEYDDVLNKQREVVYKKRRQALDLAEKELNGSVVEAPEGTGRDLSEPNDESGTVYNSLHEMMMELIEGEIEFVVSYHTNPQMDESGDEEINEKDWNVKEVYETMKTIFPLSNDDKLEIMSFGKPGEDNKSDVERRDKLVSFLIAKARHQYEELIKNVQDQVENEEDKRRIPTEIQKSVILRSTDNLWVEYLVAIDYLRQGIGLRGYGQRDPLIEYKQESFHLFNQLLANIQKEVVYTIFKVNIGLQLAPSIMADDKMTLKGAQKTSNAEAGIVQGKARDDSGNKVGRNDACPCGSGKKYKKCHGK